MQRHGKGTKQADVGPRQLSQGFTRAVGDEMCESESGGKN